MRNYFNKTILLGTMSTVSIFLIFNLLATENKELKIRLKLVESKLMETKDRYNILKLEKSYLLSPKRIEQSIQNFPYPLETLNEKDLVNPQDLPFRIVPQKNH